MPTFFYAAAIGYILGSLPAGYLVAKLAGVDIRKLGSGNIGATNVTRVLGKRFGYPVFVFDLAKGLASVELARMAVRTAQLSAEYVDLCGVLGAIFSVIGHSYSIWLGFRGGKGVATSLGALLAINWVTALIACGVWVLVFYITGYVSLASIAAVIALPATIGIMLFSKELTSPVLLYFSLCLAAIVIVRHRANLSRLLKGIEPRFVRK
jgi:glycerol-3-phosphate acyltransferase PlsY